MGMQEDQKSNGRNKLFMKMEFRIMLKVIHVTQEHNIVLLYKLVIKLDTSSECTRRLSNIRTRLFHIQH